MRISDWSSDVCSSDLNQSAAMLRAQSGMDQAPDFREPGKVHEAIEGSVIEIEGLTVVVDHAPGHTPGTVLYRMEYDGPEDVSQVMFSGDFLFQGSIGQIGSASGRERVCQYV